MNNVESPWEVLVPFAPQVSDVRERRYEASGLGSLYLFRVDDEIVVDATKRVRPHPATSLCSPQSLAYTPDDVRTLDHLHA